MAAAVALLQTTHAGEAMLALADPLPEGLDRYAASRDAVLAAADKVYRYSRTKDDKQAPKTPLKRLTLWVPDKADLAAAELAVRHGEAMAAGIDLAKELGNLPGNLCTPTYLAEQAQRTRRTFRRAQGRGARRRRDGETRAWVRCCRSRAAAVSRPS